MSKSIREILNFQDLTQEEKTRRGILGRLYGPCADIIKPTRNGRGYTDELWKNVFTKNAIVKELLANGGIPGEAQHPADRDEIDTEKIAIIMPEAPKEDSDGKLVGYWDILDTPCGRILYQLAKYGFKLGISSRGTGDLIEDNNGNEIVDPETYNFTCFDAVIIPAVESARLEMTEGLNTKTTANIINKDLNKALCESLNTASADDRKVMEETLQELNLNLTPINEELKNISDNNESKQTQVISESANNDGVNELTKSLQDALKEKSRLEAIVQTLQEQLAVSDTKANKLQEDVDKATKTTLRLSSILSKSDNFKARINSLEKQLTEKENIITNQELKIKNLVESKAKAISSTSKTLNESISNRDNEIKSLKENINTIKDDYESQIKSLNESLSKVTKEKDSKIKELNEKYNKLDSLKEGYKKLATNTVNSYIETKATMLGVTPDEIKNKLPKSYTITDINKVCESLKKYNLNINSLPISVISNRNPRIKVTESKNEILNVNSNIYDDEIDDALIKLANQKINN